MKYLSALFMFVSSLAVAAPSIDMSTGMCKLDSRQGVVQLRCNPVAMVGSEKVVVHGVVRVSMTDSKYSPVDIIPFTATENECTLIDADGYTHTLPYWQSSASIDVTNLGGLDGKKVLYEVWCSTHNINDGCLYCSWPY